MFISILSVILLIICIIITIMGHLNVFKLGSELDRFMVKTAIGAWISSFICAIISILL